ncbi:MAG: symmetrical bis(5'-nucleosyl)-tetraphosphatase [Burkholderiales bacterium]|nr:symmetrical bis(5'-nucleosyl)-tetraphosphatase [Burkholderiales bacterium]
MIYLVGDLQGCCDAFERLLTLVDFSPSRDHVYLLGDLVNRGPASLATLERLQGLGDAAHCLLGNHDLHLLASAAGVRRGGKGDTFDDILASPRRDHHLDWLRHQHLALQAHGWLMVHAGVLPAWGAGQTLALAGEVQALLRSPKPADLFSQMYGNSPSRWSDDLQGPARLRLIVNALTRMRLCSADGDMDFSVKEGASKAPPGLYAWFDAPGRRTQGVPIAFGHWSTLGIVNRPDLLALDSGCVWGGALTAARIDAGHRELFSVPCDQAQVPG